MVKLFELVMYNICFLSYTMYIKKNKKEGVCMLALQGYYDGNSVQTLEKIQAKKNQKLVITILDEFIEETPENKVHSARGSLEKYANSELLKEEYSAWEKAVVEKYENV